MKKVNKKSHQKTSSRSGSFNMRKLEALNKRLRDEEKFYKLCFKAGEQKITKIILQEIINRIQTETFLDLLQFIID